MVTYALTPSTVVDALHAELRERLVSGDLAPGEPVTEARFVADYGVARTTARGALERLLSEGLLERTQRRTLRVRRFTLDDLVDIWCVREGLESSAIRRLVRDGTVPVGSVQAQAELVELARAGADSDVRRRADVAFHRGLVRAAGSDRLDRLYSSILVEIRLASKLLVAASAGQVALAVAEHQAVLDAVVARDEEMAVQALVQHLSHARDRITRRAG